MRLSRWIPSITNNLWHAFSTSSRINFKLNYEQLFNVYLQGDEETLREKVLSISKHVTNRHTFPSNNKHKSCAHGDLGPEENRKPWLKDDSKVRVFGFSKQFLITQNFPQELRKLTTALRGHNDIRLNDLENMTGKKEKQFCFLFLRFTMVCF